MIDKSSGWMIFFGIVLFAILAIIGFGIFVVSPRITTITTTPTVSSGMPPSPSQKFAFDYNNIVSCTLPLPDGSGDFIFMQTVSDGRPDSLVCRSVRLTTDKHKELDCRLPNKTTSTSKRVDLYWYRTKSGKGPYIALRDDKDESLIDLTQGRSLKVMKMWDRVFAGPHSADGFDVYDFSRSNRKVISATINTVPAEDITWLMDKNPGSYMGSITLANGKLTFMPAEY
ncbi:MAG TPA: hypothetical protein PKV43_05900 [Armatimonadota bacterium]|jgi:hypothetical protein|nr:hypothetical protein [Armatimonadota bacterium]